MLKFIGDGIMRVLSEPLPLDHRRDLPIKSGASIGERLNKREQLGLGHQVQAGHVPGIPSMICPANPV
ncbi:hypothetical protein [Microvirga sp. VF16]|uniref:hypothetical protein n=1 Tax=Microvirga sp. VF16 TaxID=2807101 RepID=UPI00193D7DED|nr:hypothetical protein [Microvirga sp. VF16]QRM32537.1 hypothetical protein JO965_31100 [Microvirga sp. VF16]